MVLYCTALHCTVLHSNPLKFKQCIPKCALFQGDRNKVEVCKRVVRECSAILMQEKRSVAKEMEELEKLPM